MEKYQFEYKNPEFIIKHGKYYNKIHEKHEASYGQQGANNIRDNIVSTFRETQKQVLNSSLNNNILLVGKVQSGKTSNLEMFTALALDNAYNVVVIYGGYDGTLLAQTTNRFKKTFDIPTEESYTNDSPVVYSTDESTKLLNVDDDIIDDLLDSGKPIFFISMKRPAAMSKINALLSRVDKTKLKAFIIDDEGDQASLNTAKNKKEDASSTYKQILEMKQHLNDPLYLSVTATPHANIFLDEYSALRPSAIRLIEPGEGYCGAESYHLFDTNMVEVISNDDHLSLDEGRLPDSIRDAINYYIIASAIMRKRNRLYSDMIIHSHRNVDQHGIIYNCVENYIREFKEMIRFEDESLITRFEELRQCYNKYFLVKEIIPEFEMIKSDIMAVVTRIYLILKNTVGKSTQTNESLRKHKIYIGGDLLQRGVTFSNLVTTYFTRWAGDGGNMDTNLQRARWFGYREKYIDLCKLFTTADISREFTNLSEIETDLWEQFYGVQNGDLNIDEILIQSDITKQRPTRSNVVTYKRVAFKSRWLKQRYGIFDKIQLKENNNILENLVNELSFRETSAGRRDGNQSAKYAILNRTQIACLIEQIQAVFDLEPFERKPLQELLDENEIPIILMPGFDTVGRKRSFYLDNKIYALHQGADNKDKSKVIYEGDSSVIIDKNKVNIQIHKIIPKKRNGDKENELNDFTQYMFAVYIPKEKVYFVRGNE